MTTSKTAVAMVSVSVALDTEGNESLIGIDRNGVVYRYMWQRTRLNPGSTEPGSAEFLSEFWWQPLRMDTTKGPEPEIAQ